MKKLISLFFFIFFSPHIFAADAFQIPKNISVKVDFNYQQQNMNGNTSLYLIKNTFKTASNNHEWTTIQNKSQRNNDNQLILLSQVEKVSAREVALRFLVLSTGPKPTVISSPEIIVMYGQKGQVSIGENNQKLQLSVLAQAE